MSDVRQLDPSEVFRRYLVALARAEDAERRLTRLTTALAWHLAECPPCGCTTSLTALVQEPRDPVGLDPEGRSTPP